MANVWFFLSSVAFLIFLELRGSGLVLPFLLTSLGSPRSRTTLVCALRGRPATRRGRAGEPRVSLVANSPETVLLLRCGDLKVPKISKGA